MSILRLTEFTDNEQTLYDDLYNELIGIYGFPVNYILREVVDMDTVLNEDHNSVFRNQTELMAFIEDSDGFGGDGDLLSKFGLELRDEITLIFGQTEFHQKINADFHMKGDGTPAVRARPQESDLIWLPLTKSLFQITYVEHEEPFYQLNRRMGYKLTCELFEYDQEEIITELETELPNALPEADDRDNYDQSSKINTDANRLLIGDTE